MQHISGEYVYRWNAYGWIILLVEFFTLVWKRKKNSEIMFFLNQIMFFSPFFKDLCMETADYRCSVSDTPILRCSVLKIYICESIGTLFIMFMMFRFKYFSEIIHHFFTNCSFLGVKNTILRIKVVFTQSSETLERPDSRQKKACSGGQILSPLWMAWTSCF